MELVSASRRESHKGIVRVLGGRGREALRCRLRLFVLSAEHREGHEITEVANLHYPEDPKVEDNVPLLSLVTEVGALKRERNHYHLGVTKAGAHTGIEAGMRPDPRTSVHSSGRETDVPIRDPVSTADSTRRSHASQGKSCSGCSYTQRMGGPRGGAEDPARSGGAHELDRDDHKRRCALAKRCIPHTKGYICPNERKREVIAVISSPHVGQ